MNRCVQVLSLLIVLALIASSLPAVTSAAYADVQGTDLEYPVSLLTRLGVIRGFGDGTFRPSVPVTRAEFTAMAVRVRGLEAAAEFVTGVTPYPDVGPDHWGSGYVNIAADYGLIRGYPDGSFRPGQHISPIDAVVVVVRLLEAQPAGTSATAYRDAADALGLTDGLDLNLRVMSRGDVARLLANALTSPLGWRAGSPVAPADNTLLGAFPRVRTATGMVTDTWQRPLSTLNAGQIVVRSGQTRYPLDLMNSKIIDDLLGVTVQVWFEGSTALAVNPLTTDARVVTGELASAEIQAGRLQSITVGTSRYRVSEDVVIYRNHRLLPSQGLRPDQFLAGTIRAVTDDSGRITFLDAVAYDGTWVVMSTNPFARTVVVADESGVLKPVRLDAFQLVTAAEMHRAVAPLSLRPGTVVDYFLHGTGQLHLHARCTVSSVTVTGLVFDGGSVGLQTSRGVLTVGNATLSLDGNRSLDRVSAGSLALLLNSSVTVHTRPDGRVQHLAGGVLPPPGDGLAVVLEPPVRRETDRVTVLVLTEQGRIQHLRFAERAALLSGPAGTETLVSYDSLQAVLSTGTIVRVTGATGGEVAKLEVFSRTGQLDVSSLVSGALDEMVRVDGRWARFVSGAPLFVLDQVEPRVMPASAFWHAAARVSAAHAVMAGDGAIAAAVLHGSGQHGGQAVPGEAGIVIGRSASAGAVWIETGYGVRVVDAAGHFGTSDLLVIDRNGTPVKPPATLSGVGLKEVDARGVAWFFSHGTVSPGSPMLVTGDTIVLDATRGGVVSSLDRMSPDQVLSVFDLEGDGLVDYIVIVSN